VNIVKPPDSRGARGLHLAAAMRAFPILALLLGSASAYADGAWIGGVQAGVVHTNVDGTSDFEDNPTRTTSSGLAFELARRLHSRFAIGARLAIEGELVRSESEQRSMFHITWDTQYRPIHVGISASYFPTSRTWITPWVGVADDWDLRECTTQDRGYGTPSMGCGDSITYPRDRSFAYGIGGGVDLFATGPHRGGLAVSIARARDGEYTSFGLSLAYRYW
jgi:hypothetical protein